MENQSEGYNLSTILAEFKVFLNSGKPKSRNTVKNYLSDIRFFFGWFLTKTEKVAFSNVSEILTDIAVEEYKAYLIINSLPIKTINRRLSSLRQLCSFCISQQWLDHNPAKQVGNVLRIEKSTDDVVDKENTQDEAFYEDPDEAYKYNQIGSKSANQATEPTPVDNINGLQKAPDNNSTIADSWSNFFISRYSLFAFILVVGLTLFFGLYNSLYKKIPQPLAYQTSFFQGTRTLFFSGKLTDHLGNPIVNKTSTQFNLYTQARGGTRLYASGVCFVKPDFNGNFTVRIGGECGSKIPASVFSDNPTVFLGITVGTDLEMSPRTQIPNVGFAANSQKLLGLSTGKDISSIPLINDSGDILIGATHPGVRSTSVSSTFVISSANGLSLQSAGSGDLTLSATESGNLKFLIGGVEIGRVANTGRFGVGTNSPDAKFEIQDSVPQFRLTYSDDTAYTTLSTNSDGNFTLSPTGKNTFVVGSLGVGSTSPAGATLDIAGTAHLRGAASQTGLYVSSTGAVGIGLTSPSFKLEVSGTARINGATTLGDGSEDSLTVAGSTVSFSNATNVNIADSSTTSLNFESGLLNLDSTNSRVGIGTTAPTTKLQIVGGDCADDAGGGGCTADYAEIYPASESVEKGDVLVIDSTSVNSHTVKRSTEPYQTGLIGIVSTAPAAIADGSNLQFMNTGYILDPARPAVALTGRVPVKISPDSQTIKPGDALTSSATGGRAMKATATGAIIGRALESWTPNSGKDKILVTASISWYDPSLYLTRSGDLHIVTDNNAKIYSGIDGKNPQYSLLSSTGEAVENIVSGSQGIFAQLQSGLITAKRIVVDGGIKSVDILTDSIVSHIVTTDKLITQSAQITNAHIDQLTADTIVAQKKIQSPVIETQDLVASDMATIGQLSAKEATIAGTLSAQTISAHHVSADNIDEIQRLLDNIKNQPTPNPQNYQKITDDQSLAATTASNSATFSTFDNLMVYGQTTLFDSTILGTLTAGNVAIKDNQIIALNSELKLDALEKVSILDGAVTIARDGSITTKGQLVALGGIKTNKIQAVNPGDNVAVELNQNMPNTKYQILNTNGDEVASIDASGSAHFSDVSVDKYTDSSSSAIIAAADNFSQSGIDAPAIQTNNAAAGTGNLPAGSSDIVIYNSKITDTSLVYITVTAPTENKSVYVSSKKSCPTGLNQTCQPYFVVSIDSPIANNVTFNWWIVR